MNTITIAEIKKGGMAALDVALNHGVTTIVKRNRPAAIVLTPAAYALLVDKNNLSSPANSALDWLLHSPGQPQRDGSKRLSSAAMAQRLDALKNEWPER